MLAPRVELAELARVRARVAVVRAVAVRRHVVPVAELVAQEVLGLGLELAGGRGREGAVALVRRVAVVALAQFHMVDLTLAQQAIIVLTATLASIGAAAIPSAGLVLMIIVLESVGLNPAWIALIFPVDRILDMCRTVVNVTGDGTVSALVAQSEGELHHDS